MFKKAFKGCLIIIISFFSIVIIFSLLYYFSQKSKISNMNKSVTESWSEIYSLSFERLLLIKDFAELHKINDSNYIDLQNEISFEIENREIYSNFCDLQFVLEEYKIDSCYMKTLMDTTKLTKKSTFYINKVDSIDKILNLTILGYNDLVERLNTSVMIIPSRLIAKHLGVDRREYFSIKYGEINKNPIAEKQKFFERLNEVDSIFERKNKSID